MGKQEEMDYKQIVSFTFGIKINKLINGWINFAQQTLRELELRGNINMNN